MNWEMIGAIGEIAGAVAVVVSLVYLARQIRDSSVQDRRTQYTQLNRDFLQFNDWIIRDAGYGDLIYRGIRDRDALGPAEILRFNAGMLGQFRAQEALFHYHREGGVHDWGADAYASTMIDWVGLPGVQAYWHDRRHWFSAAFGEEVDRWMAQQSQRLLDGYQRAEQASPPSGEA